MCLTQPSAARAISFLQARALLGSKPLADPTKGPDDRVGSRPADQHRQKCQCSIAQRTERRSLKNIALGEVSPPRFRFCMSLRSSIEVVHPVKVAMKRWYLASNEGRVIDDLINVNECSQGYPYRRHNDTEPHPTVQLCHIEPNATDDAPRNTRRGLPGRCRSVC